MSVRHRRCSRNRSCLIHFFKEDRCTHLRTGPSLLHYYNLQLLNACFQNHHQCDEAFLSQSAQYHISLLQTILLYPPLETKICITLLQFIHSNQQAYLPNFLYYAWLHSSLPTGRFFFKIFFSNWLLFAFGTFTVSSNLASSVPVFLERITVDGALPTSIPDNSDALDWIARRESSSCSFDLCFSFFSFLMHRRVLNASNIYSTCKMHFLWCSIFSALKQKE